MHKGEVHNNYYTKYRKRIINSDFWMGEGGVRKGLKRSVYSLSKGLKGEGSKKV